VNFVKIFLSKDHFPIMSHTDHTGTYVEDQYSLAKDDTQIKEWSNFFFILFSLINILYFSEKN